MRRKSKGPCCLAFAVVLSAAVGCSTSPGTAQEARATAPGDPTPTAPPETRAPPPPEEPFDPAPYPWLSEDSSGLTEVRALDLRFQPPEGFRRVPVSADTFGAWLRGLPVRTDRTEVLAYDDTPLDRPSAAVLLMDVGSRDLMQCADSLIRLHAEFLWSKGRSDEAGYRFTSGELSRWSDWQDGERFTIEGNRVRRRRGSPRTDDHRSYRRWLDLIFTYAGTASLARDTPVVPPSQKLHAGDFFVDPGFPGHAVILLDIAEDESGRRLALVGQGFMPAEELHVVRSSAAIDGVWFPLPRNVSEVLDTPSWDPFARTDARRFP